MNEKDKNGMNLLHQSISNASLYASHPTVAGYIIQSGKIEISATDINGRSALHMALTEKHDDLAKNLVAHGADIDQKNREGVTPLLLALQNGLEPFASSIVDKVSDVEELDQNQSSSLHLAIDQKFESLALKLLARTKKINQAARNQETAVFKAVQQNSVTLVKALIERGADLDLATSYQAPIHVALKNQVAEIVSLLIATIKNIEAKNSDSQTPLIMAVVTGTDAQVSQLLARGAQVDNSSGSKESPLHMATSHNYLQKMNLLIAAKANVNALTVEGKSPLFYSTATSAIEILLQAKAQVNTTSTAGSTPLSTFVNSDNTQLALYLADRGADVNWKDGKKRSLLEISVLSNNMTLAAYFLQKKINANDMNLGGETCLFSARTIEMVNLLVANGADINFKSKDSETILSQKIAQYNGYATKDLLSLIRRLLELGASTELRDLNGNSFLHLATSAMPLQSNGAYLKMNTPYDNSALIDLLTSFNTNVAVVNKAGDAAIHMADTSKEVQSLNNARADLNLRNKLGETPRDKVSKKLALLNTTYVADLEKLKVLTAQLKEAEEKGNQSLINVYRRQINELNQLLEIEKTNIQILTETLDTLTALGAH